MLRSVAFGCYVAGTVAFLRFFYLAVKLKKERIGAPAPRAQAWFPWLPGKFTPAGERIRQRMNGLMILGWVFLLTGLAIGPR